jgi:hypothetical protein
MNDCENSRPFKTPRTAAIEHGLSPDLVIFARALDTIGSAYMSRDGASWLDNQGMDSLIGSALPNDVMDLHTDIFTGETRNLLRLLYPAGLNIAQAIQTTSTVLSSMLCEIFRGHHRARLHNREDGRISSTSPPYSFCRARHRRIFETLELYMNKYPQFWDWYVTSIVPSHRNYSSPSLPRLPTRTYLTHPPSGRGKSMPLQNLKSPPQALPNP